MTIDGGTWFIAVHDTQGGRYILNPAHITSVVPDGAGSLINMAERWGMHARESYEEIAKLLGVWDVS